MEEGLTEFEEIVMYLTGKLKRNATLVAITRELESAAFKTLPMGKIHATLDKLTALGFIESKATHKGGRLRRVYTLNKKGKHLFTKIQSIAPEMLSDMSYHE